MAGTATYFVCDYTGVSYANGASDTLAWDNGSRMSPHTFNITGTKTVNGTTTSYLHDGTREIAEYDNGGTLAARHVFSGDDQVLATLKIVNPNTENQYTDYLYYHKDIQGSVVALTDASRNLRGQVTYSPFGESGNIAPAASFGYTGQRYDGETGLYFYKARYYSPKLGRFMSNDPIGYKDNLNLYAYTGNDPLNFTDPSGLAADAITGVADVKYSMLGQALADRMYSGESRSDLYNFSGAMANSFTAGLVNFPGADSNALSYSVGEYTALGMEIGAMFYTGNAAGAMSASRFEGSLSLLDSTFSHIGKTGPIGLVDSEQSLMRLHSALTSGGDILKHGNYPGSVIEAVDGAIIRMRNFSKSGGRGSTVDAELLDGTIFKVHIKQ